MNQLYRVICVSTLVLLAAACSDDTSGTQTGDTGGDVRDDADPGDTTDDTDAPDSDANDDSADGAPDQPEPDAHDDLADLADLADGSDETTDATESECLQVTISDPWLLERDDDVSIAFNGVVMPFVETDYRTLTLLFERYVPGPDVGTFELGPGDDENFGSCRHCVAMTAGASTRGFFADRGTLELHSDPYSRRLEATVTDLRLVEVTIDQFTRASTPVPDGICVEPADFTIDQLFTPEGWTCLNSAYNDGEFCHCECGAFDPDCDEDPECAFNPECEPEDPLPLADCSADEICSFDPEVFSTACFATCDWAAGDVCDEGTCVYDFGLGDGDTCIDSDERIDDATFGDDCTVNGYQNFCNVVDGFALGFCGPENVCRVVCDEEADCPDEAESCRRFLGEEGLGYCGPEPSDG